MEMLADSPAYRPTVINAGGHRNWRGHQRFFGQELSSHRWRICSVSDGLLQWRHRGRDITVGPGEWGLLPPNDESGRLSTSANCVWRDVRFAAMPESRVDAQATELWGIDLPDVLPADLVRQWQGALDDLIAWWWRDPWHHLRADTRLASMLVGLVHSLKPADRKARIRDDGFAAADRIWATRPLAPVAELAEACGYSERHFRRAFATVRRCTPSVWSRRMMAKTACDLLREHADWSIKQVAHHLGYRHAPTFIRAFHEEIGAPPAEWRRQRASEA